MSLYMTEVRVLAQAQQLTVLSCPDSVAIAVFANYSSFINSYLTIRVKCISSCVTVNVKAFIKIMCLYKHVPVLLLFEIHTFFLVKVCSQC